MRYRMRHSVGKRYWWWFIDDTMQRTITDKLFKFHSRFKIPGIWVGIVALSIGLSVFQDYVYSRVQNTDFYISESLLYNSIWAFLVPLALLQIRLLRRFNFNNKLKKIATLVALSGVLTLTHLFIFASFFVSVSYFAFSPTHHFSHIFNAALSNQFYILVLFYVFIPFVSLAAKKTAQYAPLLVEYPESINVKRGLKTISLKTETIERISTQRPYTELVSCGKNYLDHRTLKEFETILNPKHFVRVHRSAMINKNTIKELKSRQNGDYDCLLQNGEIVRFSRHYRANWQDLLQ